MNLVFVGDPTPILQTLVDGRLDDPRAFAIKRQAEELATWGDLRRLRALSDGRVRLFPHQERAVWKVLNELRGRAILADEVGLGKTVEAAVILQEYRLRGLVSRALILVPPGLLGHWRGELQRLGVPVELSVSDSDDAEYPGVWLASLAKARRTPLASDLASRPWDMVIVDEAHRLRSASNKSWQLVNSLRSRFLLLLTATPVQNDLKELYTLVTLLKPGQLDTYSRFRRRFMMDRHRVRDVTRLRELLGEVMVRSSRREALLRFPARRLHALMAEPEPEERAAYEAALHLARDAYSRLREEDVHWLPFIQLLRITASHPLAGLPTVRKMMDASPPGSHGWPPRERLETVARALARLKGADSAVETGRMRVLRAWLTEHGSGRKVIIFTEFRRVQAILMDWLSGWGWRCRCVHGSQTAAEREAELRAFAREDDLLISTDAGSEGHNWQWASTVVNFDLPWNPMRIEQRIGRVYRLGQTRDVDIVNLIVEGTVEEYVASLLHRKVGMFEQAIGDLDDMLGIGARALRRRLVDAVLGGATRDDPQRQREALEREVETWARRTKPQEQWDRLLGDRL